MPDNEWQKKKFQIKTMTVHEIYGISLVTALTAQNTMGVIVFIQILCPDAVKIGMTVSSVLIKVILERLTYYQAKNIVLDPVMVSTSGTLLLDKESRKDLVR